MPFLLPNQQHQSTEGQLAKLTHLHKTKGWIYNVKTGREFSWSAWHKPWAASRVLSRLIGCRNSSDTVQTSPEQNNGRFQQIGVHINTYTYTNRQMDLNLHNCINPGEIWQVEWTAGHIGHCQSLHCSLEGVFLEWGISFGKLYPSKWNGGICWGYEWACRK